MQLKKPILDLTHPSAVLNLIMLYKMINIVIQIEKYYVLISIGL